jgi:hypothetical protein
MTTPLTPTPVRLGATLPIPSDAELADSASLAGPLQPCANAIEWASRVCDVLVTGGGLVGTNNVSLATGAGKVYSINGLIIPAQIDTQEISYAGSIQARRRILKATGSAGVQSVPYYTELMYLNTTPASGVIWRLTDPPSGDATRAWLVKCVNISGVGTTTIDIQNAAGTLIGVIHGADSNQRYSETFAWTGSAWSICDQAYFP